MSAGDRFSKGRLQVLLPTVDVCVAGSFSGGPIILMKTFQPGIKKKHHLKAMLDLIPDCEATELKKDVPSEALQVTDEFGFYQWEKGVMDEEYNDRYSRMNYLENEDDEFSMFNAGLRMGVGIGLGACLGVGVGIGLLIRTYQAATRGFKIRLI